jgi:hypothetical protein
MGELRHREPDRQCLAALDPTPALTRSHFPTYDGHPLGYGVGRFIYISPQSVHFVLAKCSWYHGKAVGIDALLRCRIWYRGHSPSH